MLNGIDNVDFIEAHTGDEDIKIEKVIFSECLKANPDIEKRLFKTKEEKERIEKEKAEKKTKKKSKKLSKTSKYFDFYDDIKAGCHKIVDW